MVAVVEDLNARLRGFESLRERAAGEPEWLQRRRRPALERFFALGIPTVKNEEYKYTDLSALPQVEFFDAPPAADTSAAAYRGLGGFTLRFDSGRLAAAEGEVPQGVSVRSIAERLRNDPDGLESLLGACAAFEDHALAARNTACFEDGAVIEVAPGAVVEEPIHLVFAAASAVSNARVLIAAGRNSQVRVIESYIGAGKYWTNAVTEVYAGENAVVEHYRAQLESAEAFHTGCFQAVQERASKVSTFSLSFGAAVARNDINTRLNGEGCECALDGLYAVKGGQHVDHHTAIDHVMPHCNSHQLYKGVLDGSATGVFNGKIFVRRNAQKTDAIQNNKNLLLSDKADINTKPQLEIDANDVRCTHGATIGQLDAAALFYMQSRGIDVERARNLLTYAFAADALERIRLEPLRTHFENLLLRTFADKTEDRQGVTEWRP